MTMIAHLMYIFSYTNKRNKNEFEVCDLVTPQEQPGMVVEIPMKESELIKEAEAWDMRQPRRWYDIQLIWYIM